MGSTTLVRHCRIHRTNVGNTYNLVHAVTLYVFNAAFFCRLSRLSVKKMFNMDKFIVYVHEKPALWEKSSKEYSDKVSRDRSWIEIGEILYDDWKELDSSEKDEKVKEMKNKWRHVRDNFLKSLNRGKSGDSALKTRKYIYADVLQFLLNTVKKRKTSGNIEEYLEEGEDKERKDNEKNNNEEEHLEGEENKLISNSQLSKAPQSESRKRKTNKITPFQQALLKKLNASDSSRQQEDADKSFLLSLLPDYKKLNDDEKIDFRLLTLQFFQNIRRKYNVGNLPTGSSTRSYYPTQMPPVSYCQTQIHPMNLSYQFHPPSSPM